MPHLLQELKAAGLSFYEEITSNVPHLIANAPLLRALPDLV